MYPDEAAWWSFNDYAAVLSVMDRLRPRRVLEFGPGSSTLALIEGGAEVIDACEDQLHWLNLHTERMWSHRQVLTLHRFEWSDPLTTPIDDQSYDLALIDGPLETARRRAVIDYCLQRCAAVLVPLECAHGDDHVRAMVWTLAEKYGCMLETWPTGPLAGAFALMTRVP